MPKKKEKETVEELVIPTELLEKDQIYEQPRKQGKELQVNRHE